MMVGNNTKAIVKHKPYTRIGPSQSDALYLYGVDRSSTCDQLSATKCQVPCRRWILPYRDHQGWCSCEYSISKSTLDPIR